MCGIWLGFAYENVAELTRELIVGLERFATQRCFGSETAKKFSVRHRDADYCNNRERTKDSAELRDMLRDCQAHNTT